MQSRDQQYGIGFSPEQLVEILRKRIWVVVLTTLVLTAAAVGIAALRVPEYEATAKVLVGQEAAGGERVTSLGSDIQGLQQATQTVAVGIASRPVAETVIEDMGLSTEPAALIEDLSVQQVQATQFVEITYSDTDPQRAEEIVNGVANAASARISGSSAGASGIETSVWEYASPPEGPSGVGPARVAAIALGLGLMLGVGLAFLREYLDDSLETPEVVEAVTGVPTFGSIPEFAVKKG